MPKIIGNAQLRFYLHVAKGERAKAHEVNYAEVHLRYPISLAEWEEFLVQIQSIKPAFVPLNDDDV